MQYLPIIQGLTLKVATSALALAMAYTVYRWPHLATNVFHYFETLLPCKHFAESLLIQAGSLHLSPLGHYFLKLKVKPCQYVVQTISHHTLTHQN